MKKIKKILYSILGDNLGALINEKYTYLTKGVLLFSNMRTDAKLFLAHSTMVNKKTMNAVEARIILHYHAIEKGFLHSKFKHRFGKNRVETLIYYLKNTVLIGHVENMSQVHAAYLALCTYYERHQEDGIDISDYFSKEDYDQFKKELRLKDTIVQVNSRQEFYKDNEKSFDVFAHTRKSVRNFTGEKIPLETLYKAIDIAKSAPSVCNRQPSRVYCIENKEKIDKIFEIQGGLGGFTKEVSQLIVLTTDRSYFYSVGERNQLYIDGGIFLMNLLYALHFYKIGTCPAHWAKEKEDDRKIQKIIPLNKAEKVICIIPIGIPKDSFKTTLSERRNKEEILQIIN